MMKNQFRKIFGKFFGNSSFPIDSSFGAGYSPLLGEKNNQKFENYRVILTQENHFYSIFTIKNQFHHYNFQFLLFFILSLFNICFLHQMTLLEYYLNH